jgi:hypothetical protein
MTFRQKTRISEDVNLKAEKLMVLLLPNVLWNRRLRKYVKSYKQERYYSAKLLCEEANVIFTIGIKKQ